MDSYGHDIHNQGVVVDEATLPGDLAPDSSDYTVPTGINSKGTIIGHGETPGEQTSSHAFHAEAPGYTFVDLGTFGGSSSHANGISDNGLIVGYARNASGLRRAFIADMHQGAVMKDLGTPAGIDTRTHGVNNHGQVVGKYLLGDGVTFAAFVCSGTCSDFADLNTITSGLPAGVQLVYATVIDKKGRIVARGNDNYGYLLTPQESSGSAAALNHASGYFLCAAPRHIAPPNDPPSCSTFCPVM